MLVFGTCNYHVFSIYWLSTGVLVPSVNNDNVEYYLIMLSVIIVKLMVTGNIPHSVCPSITIIIRSGGRVIYSSSSLLLLDMYSNSDNCSLSLLPDTVFATSLLQQQTLVWRASIVSAYPINGHLTTFNSSLQRVDEFVLFVTSLFQLGHLLEEFHNLFCKHCLLIVDDPEVLPLVIGSGVHSYQVFVNPEELSVVCRLQVVKALLENVDFIVKIIPL